MAKCQKKPVEWKNTRFAFSAEYDFSLFVRNRCIFFHCLARNIRKMINYAEALSQPNQICVIYVYGEIHLKKDPLENRKGNLLLLNAADITSEDISVLTEYSKWLEKLRNGGYREIINPGYLKRGVFVDRVYGDKPNEIWYESFTPPSPEYASDPFYKEYYYGMNLIKREKQARERISEQITGKLKCLATFPAPSTISGAADKHNAELTAIIKSLYPYGVESDTDNEYAVKRLAVKKLVAAAYEDKETNESAKLGITFGEAEVQLSFWSIVTIGATECIAFLRQYCENLLKEQGCFNVAEAWYLFTQPPYGAYECNWYEYLFACVMREYDCSPYFWGDTLLSDKVGKAYSPRYKYGFVYIQNERQNEFRLLLAKMFDIEDPPASTHVLLYQVCNWITEHIFYAPLDCLSPKWHEILAGKDDVSRFTRKNIKTVFTPIYWYRFGYEDDYLPWLKENFNDMYSRIRTFNDDFRNYLAEKYGQARADGFCKYKYIKGSAVGWLHTRENIKREIDSYMSNEFCRECGNIIKEIGCKSGLCYVYEQIGESKSYEFSVKDVIGINKKLLGRQREEYYCIPCLAEICDTTPPELWELIHDFKEQGCTLFS